MTLFRRLIADLSIYNEEKIFGVEQLFIHLGENENIF